MILLIILFTSLYLLYEDKYSFIKRYNNNIISKEYLNKSFDIIVARYNEDLSWTLEHPFNNYEYIVYNKGNNDNFEKKYVKLIINLPNVGRCDHTYLYHIVNNYYNLADINLFITGSIGTIHEKKKKTKTILKLIEKTNNAVFINQDNDINNNIKNKFYNFTLDNWKSTDTNNSIDEEKLKHSSIRPYGKWYESIFGDINCSEATYYGIFSISKNDIIQNSLDKYKLIIKELETHSNPEAGHYVERSWCAIFHKITDTLII